MYRLTKKELVEAINIPIFYLRKSLVLSHKVKLSTENLKGGDKDYFHKEFTYPGRVDGITQRVSTLRLSHQSLLTLEYKEKDGDYHEPLIINTVNQTYIYKGLKYFKKKVLDKDDLLLQNADDEIYVNPAYSGIFKFSPYGVKVMGLRPILTDEGKLLVELCLDLKNPVFIGITEQMFSALIRTVKRFDFHLAGLAAVTYLQAAEIGKFEINVSTVPLIDFDEENFEPVINLKTQQKKDSGIDKLKTVNSNPSMRKPNNGW